MEEKFIVTDFHSGIIFTDHGSFGLDETYDANDNRIDILRAVDADADYRVISSETDSTTDTAKSFTVIKC